YLPSNWFWVDCPPYFSRSDVGSAHKLQIARTLEQFHWDSVVRRSPVDSALDLYVCAKFPLLLTSRHPKRHSKSLKSAPWLVATSLPGWEMSKSKWGSTWTTSRPGIPNGGKSESFVLRAEELNIPFTAWSPCVRLRRGPLGYGT